MICTNHELADAVPCAYRSRTDTPDLSNTGCLVLSCELHKISPCFNMVKVKRSAQPIAKVTMGADVRPLASGGCYSNDRN
jgi:hypothetical protein